MFSQMQLGELNHLSTQLGTNIEDTRPLITATLTIIEEMAASEAMGSSYVNGSAESRQ